MFFYQVDATLGDPHGVDMLYFHSYRRREDPTQLRRDMTILPRIEGRGRFLGCVLGIRQNPATNKYWWGEGEVKAYLDGDEEFPTVCGTGTEDYIGTGWGQDVQGSFWSNARMITVPRPTGTSIGRTTVLHRCRRSRTVWRTFHSARTR